MSGAAAVVGSTKRTMNDRTLGILGIAVAVVALSAGSTMVRSTGAKGSVVAFWRLAVGAALWQIILLVTRQRFTWAIAKKTALPGFLFGINLICFFTGITKTRIANAEFIGTLSPLFVLPIAARRLGERIRPRIVVAGAAALCGVALILLLADRDVVGTHSWVGDALCIASVATWCAYLFATKSVRRELGVGPFMAGMTLVAAITVTPLAVSTGELTKMSTKGWVLIGVMCVTSGLISHGLLAWSQRAVPVSTLSLMQLAQPGFAVIWAWTFLNERVNGTQVIGMAVVLVAVGFIARASAQPSGSAAARERNVALTDPSAPVVAAVAAPIGDAP